MNFSNKLLNPDPYPAYITVFPDQSKSSSLMSDGREKLFLMSFILLPNLGVSTVITIALNPYNSTYLNNLSVVS